MPGPRRSKRLSDLANARSSLDTPVGPVVFACCPGSAGAICAGADALAAEFDPLCPEAHPAVSANDNTKHVIPTLFIKLKKIGGLKPS
jgi:hypothetical protein